MNRRAQQERGLLAVLAVMVTALGGLTSLFGGTSASAAGVCSPGFYQVISGDLVVLDPTQSPAGYTTVKSGPGHMVNATFYWAGDLYGAASDGDVVKYDLDDGTISFLGYPGLISGSSLGDISPDGVLFTAAVNGSSIAITNFPEVLAGDPAPSQLIATTPTIHPGDFAYFDGALWSANGIGGQPGIHRFDVAALDEVTELEAAAGGPAPTVSLEIRPTSPPIPGLEARYGSSWISTNPGSADPAISGDTDAVLYSFSNSTGTIAEYQRFEATDPALAGVRSAVYSSPPNGNNDGASCPLAPSGIDTSVFPSDFGDAPASFGDASALISSGYSIGATNDAENDGSVPDSSDDGVIVAGVDIESMPLDSYLDHEVVVAIPNDQGFVSAWVDIDRDGSFDATDRVLVDAVPSSGEVRFTLNATHTAPVTGTDPIPDDVSVVLRVRLAARTGGAATGGPFSFGEVEDHVVTWSADLDGDGIDNLTEGYGDPDNDGVGNALDFDSDGDGVPDSEEGRGDFDNDGIPDAVDTDSDNDGIPDGVEGTGDVDGDGYPNHRDADSDGDGIPDLIEAGADPMNPVDTDGDGVADFLDRDSDGDGIPDAVESPMITLNGRSAPLDTDGDGRANSVDSDSDNDGIPDSVEAGADPMNPVDRDGDGAPDYLDIDSDNDGIPDSVEAGADPMNPVDRDGDGVPDSLDTDSDNDGIPDSIEGWADADGDGVPDSLDTDSDNDGIPDEIEGAGDADGDGVPDSLDLDSDGDGIPDRVESNIDSDGDGIPDYLDLDSDNDGIPDADEPDGDTDGDGIVDRLDTGVLVEGRVYLDTNRNGEYDDGERHLSGVTVVLVGAGPDDEFGTGDDFEAQRQITASPYRFDPVPPGLYRIHTVAESLPLGIGATDDVSGGSDHRIDVRIVDTPVLQQDFGVAYRYVTGRLLNSDGSPASGVSVTLTGPDGATYATVTNADGEYTIGGSAGEPLVQGSYRGTAVLSDGTTMKVAHATQTDNAEPHPISIPTNHLPSVGVNTVSLLLAASLLVMAGLSFRKRPR